MASAWRALAALGCAILAHSAPALAQDSLAAAIKATYLYKLAPFIDWPEQGKPRELDAPATFDICVVGEDPFGRLLDDAVAGQRVRSQPIRVRHFPSVEGGADGCKIMYVAGSAVQSIAAALEETRGFPVLTVTDDKRSPKWSGIIHFVEKDGRIRFRIDDAMAAEGKLVISSKLLDLAVSVNARAGSSRLE